MHDVLGVPFSFTWEIFGEMEAHFNDCFRMFNPTSKEHLDEVRPGSCMIQKSIYSQIFIHSNFFNFIFNRIQIISRLDLV